MEARRYLTSTDTSTTEVGNLPWKNRTTIPKLTQIADNLHAYYMAALMPADDWFVFEGSDEESRMKAKYIERYFRIKLQLSGFRQALEDILRDWITYGNCFGSVKWIKKSSVDLITRLPSITYVGPKLERLPPTQCVMDPRASNFDSTPFISRALVPLGDVMLHNETAVTPPYDPEVLNKINLQLPINNA